MNNSQIEKATSKVDEALKEFAVLLSSNGFNTIEIQDQIATIVCDTLAAHNS